MVDKVLIIKKYQNRRLYNTGTSSYITLADLADLIKRSYSIKVVDVKTGEDLTKVTLTQIILEQQQNGYDMFPLEMLQQFIKLQDKDMGKIFFDYIKLSIEYFTNNYSYTNTLMGKLESNAIENNALARSIEIINQNNIKFMQMALSAINMFSKSDKKVDADI